MIKILSLASWRRLAQGGFLALALLATGGAWAAPAANTCDVSLSSILPSNQALLKADCGTANVTSITWKFDGASLGTFNFPGTLADINFSTLLTSGTHSYTASGLAGSTALAEGKAAVITLAQPILTVGASAGGSVTSVPPGISTCTVNGGVCAFGYNTGTTVVLTPIASANNTFVGWGGDCNGIGNCTVSMTTLRTVTATFSSVPTSPLSVTVSGGGSVSGSGISCSTGGAGTCSANIASGTQVTLTAAPTGSNTISWSGACSGSSTTCQFTMGSSAASVTATFSAAPTTPALNVTINGGGSVSGTVNCSSGTCPANIASGTVVTLTPAPTGSNTFAGWAGCPAGSFANPCSFTMGTATVDITANFMAGTAAIFPLNVTISGGGSVSGSVNCSSGTCPANIASGTAVTLAAAPTGSNTFGGWTGCASTNSSCSFTMSAATNVTATFNSSSPTSASCGAGEVFGQGDANMPANLGAFPAQALATSDRFGRAIRFVADATNWPNGIVLGLFDQSNEQLPKDFVISACAHNFTPVNNGSQNCQQTGVGAAGGVSLRYGAPRASYDCALTPGATYYLNFRSSNVGQAPNVSSQLNALPNAR